MKTSRLFRYTLAASMLAGPVAAAAGGHPPQNLFFESVQESQPMARCGDFLILVEGIGSNHVTTHFDRAGTPIRATFHGIYNGTMTNSVTGKVLTDTPSVINMTVDLQTGTQVVVGALWTVTVPGTGAVLIEAGRLVFEGSGPPTFIAGQHLPPPDTIAVLCNALR
ncbi:MAG TPA: hypothetical protein VND91_11720 [Candidatus Saccharimonadia bacterium]|nr:hypothetical protein [Candidatus Saccharimonadia bacterium]